jgi:hypothetical protein
MLSNYLLFLFVLMLIGTVVRPLSYVTLAFFFTVIVEWIITGGRIRRLAVERGHQTRESNMGLGFYAGSRAYIPRSWRRPAPRVKLGDTI